MAVRFCLPLFLFAFFLFAGCAGSKSSLGTIGKENLALDEFEQMFSRNNGGWEQASKSGLEERKHFLDLFVKYKLKLMEARNQGLMQDSSIQDEIKSYRASVATSYALEKELIEPSLKKLHARQLEEVRASHILVRVAQNAPPLDTLVAYTKALNLRDMLKTMPFDSVAHKYSEDPSAATNFGNLGWFSQGRMVSEFEDGAYALQPGEVSSPVRSRFGYHLIKVTARQPNKGEVKVSHILRRFAQDLSDTAIVKDSLDFILQRIKNNEITFGQAAYLYSDDPASRPRGGELGYYSRAQVPDTIASIFFSTQPGTIAPPYRAAYGYHVFMVTEFKPPSTFAEAEKTLRDQYKQLYYPTAYEAYVHSLTGSYHLNFDVRLRYELSHAFDSTKTAATPGWSAALNPDWLPRKLFSFGNKVVTVGDFIHHVDIGQEFKSTLLTPDNVDDLVERMAESKILDEHTSTVGQRFSTFDTLMQEYENGALIYRIEQDEIWNKVVVNDSSLQDFYQSHRKNYRWPLRINIVEIWIKSDSLAKALYARIQKGEDIRDLAEEYTMRPGYKEKRGEWGFQPVTTNDLFSTAISMRDDSIAAPLQFESGWSIIKRFGKEPMHDKTFDEALPEVTSQFQESAAKLREEAWIESLKKKYGVLINEEMLVNAFKRNPGGS